MARNPRTDAYKASVAANVKLSIPEGSTARSKMPKTVLRSPQVAQPYKRALTAEEKAQAKALAELMKKRETVAKKTGIWPNYKTN